jgi:hypothetical protein
VPVTYVFIFLCVGQHRGWHKKLIWSPWKRAALKTQISDDFCFWKGEIRGVVEQSRDGRDFGAFYGIPFAKPPVGELRWKPPEPASKWEKVWGQQRPVFNNMSLPLGVKFAHKGQSSPLSSPPPGKTHYCLEEWRGEQRIFIHRGQSSPLGASFTPGSWSSPLGSRLKTGFSFPSALPPTLFVSNHPFPFNTLLTRDRAASCPEQLVFVTDLQLYSEHNRIHLFFCHWKSGPGCNLEDRRRWVLTGKKSSQQLSGYLVPT